MLLRDRALWQAQRAEADDEYGEGFLDFVESWCHRAERSYASGTGSSATPLAALRATLNPTEAERGVLPPGWTAQMLLVIAASWGYGGPQLLEQMTAFEKKMCADMAAVVGVGVVDDGPVA